MGCLELRSSYAARVTAAESRWFAGGVRIEALKARMERIKSGWPADSFCYAQAQGLIDNLTTWVGVNGPVAITMVGGASGSVGEINCSAPQATWEQLANIASGKVAALEDWVEARDQELGTFEAQGNQIGDNCPVAAPVGPPVGPGGGD
jgi:hypothetical protein